MYAKKTAAELAADFISASAAVKPFEEVFRKRIEKVIKVIKDFHEEKHWRSEDEKFSWVEHVINPTTKTGSVLYPTVEVGNITSTGIYFTYSSDNHYEDGAFLAFSDMDNIETVLNNEYAIYAAKRQKIASQWKSSGWSRLQKELTA